MRLVDRALSKPALHDAGQFLEAALERPHWLARARYCPAQPAHAAGAGEHGMDRKQTYGDVDRHVNTARRPSHDVSNRMHL